MRACHFHVISDNFVVANRQFRYSTNPPPESPTKSDSFTTFIFLPHLAPREKTGSGVLAYFPDRAPAASKRKWDRLTEPNGSLFICATPFRVDFGRSGFPRVLSAPLGFVVEPLRGKIVDCGATVPAYAAVGRS